MKFKVRDGFVCPVTVEANVGGGRTERQESAFHGGQVVDFDTAEAELHAAKLEPEDDDARAWLQALHQPAPVPLVQGFSPEQLHALALQLAPQLLAILQAEGAPAKRLQ